MRLLSIEASGRVSLVGPYYKDVPRYAILSHTWGADGDEVTFLDMQNGNAQARPGYKKLQFCGSQAVADGLSHFWVDTCCIDKSSSAELSEAINSMYRYYEQATHCYAYLQDVPNCDSSQWKTSFRSSRWFRRGWTLQELLAPASVKFYAADNAFIGTKNDLESFLSDVTSIPARALESLCPNMYSRREIKRWTTGRVTTRAEDMVYCLLGLYGVCMPIVYGEGVENATLRLNELLDRKYYMGRSSRDNEQNVSGSTHPCEKKPNGADPSSKRWQNGRIDYDDLNLAERRLFESLWYPSMGERLREIEEPAHRSGTWLYDHQSFKIWEASRQTRGPKSLLWLKGAPGAGKSVLLKAAYLNAQTCRLERGDLVASFFFTSRGDALDRNPVGLYRSLIYQLCMQDREFLQRVTLLSDNALPWTSLHPRWTLQGLMQVFRRAVETTSRHVIIFIDGLDECMKASMRSQAEQLRRMAITIQNLRACVACRHFPHLNETGNPVVYLDALNADDIDAYVDGRLASYISQGLESEWRMLRYKIGKKASGCFLWTTLTLDCILEKFDEGQNVNYLLGLVSGLPIELRGLFNHLLADLEGADRALSVSLLRWASLALEQLRVDEWHHILALTQKIPFRSLASWRTSDVSTRTDEQLVKRIRTLSRGLIEVKTVPENINMNEAAYHSVIAGAGSLDEAVGGTRFLQVIHDSVRDYVNEDLLRYHYELDNDWPPEISSQEIKAIGHFDILQDCLRYIDMAELDAFVEAHQKLGTASQRTSIAGVHQEALERQNQDSNEPCDRTQYTSRNPGDMQSSEAASPNHVVDQPCTHAPTRNQFESSSCPRERDRILSSDGRSRNVQEPKLLKKSHVSLSTSGVKRFRMIRDTRKSQDIGTEQDSIQRVGHPSPLDPQTIHPRLDRKLLRVDEDIILEHRQQSIHEWLEGIPLANPDSLETNSQWKGHPIVCAPVSASGRSRILGDHMALLSYISTFFWHHALHTQASGLIKEDLVDRVLDHKTWRRWQAVDPYAPSVPIGSRSEAQYNYLEAIGLETWASYAKGDCASVSSFRSCEDEKATLPTGQDSLLRTEPALPRCESVASFGSAGSHHSGGLQVSYPTRKLSAPDVENLNENLREENKRLRSDLRAARLRIQELENAIAARDAVSMAMMTELRSLRKRQLQPQSHSQSDHSPPNHDLSSHPDLS